jgi:hypothetical protein
MVGQMGYCTPFFSTQRIRGKELIGSGRRRAIAPTGDCADPRDMGGATEKISRAKDANCRSLVCCRSI